MLFVLLFTASNILDIPQEIPILGGFQQTPRTEWFRPKHGLESEWGLYFKSDVSNFWVSAFIHKGSSQPQDIHKWNLKETLYIYSIYILV